MTCIPRGEATGELEFLVYLVLAATAEGLEASWCKCFIVMADVDVGVP